MLVRTREPTQTMDEKMAKVIEDFRAVEISAAKRRVLKLCAIERASAVLSNL
jgi:hypothetical protein